MEKGELTPALAGDGGSPRQRAVVAGVLCLLAVLAGARLFQVPVEALFNGWSDARLSASAAFVHGYGLYSVPGEGPLVGNTYGPVFGLFFVPAVLLPTPASAVCAGVVAAMVMFFVPAGVLLASEHAPRRCVVAAFLCFVFLSYVSDILRGPASGVHPDPLALGFSALACAALYSPERRGRTGVLALSALATVLAVGSKQVAVGLPVGIAAYLWIAEGASTALRYLIVVAAIGVGVLAAIGAVVDLRLMVQAAILVPTAHPWRGAGGAAALLAAARDLVPRAFPFFLAPAAWAWVDRPRLESWRDWIRRNGWLLVILIAIVSIPASLLGRAKVRGTMNTLCYTTYFAALGFLLVVLRSGRGVPAPLRALDGRRVATAALLSGAAFLAAFEIPRLRGLAEILRQLPENPESTAFAFARAHAGEVYFPFHGLVTILSEGRAHHTMAGAEEFEDAGQALDESQFHEFRPPALRWVLVRRPVWIEEPVLRFLPGFRKRVERNELPGWTALVESAPP